MGAPGMPRPGLGWDDKMGTKDGVGAGDGAGAGNPVDDMRPMDDMQVSYELDETDRHFARLRR
jgi:hypothetical protein